MALIRRTCTIYGFDTLARPLAQEIPGSTAGWDGAADRSAVSNDMNVRFSTSMTWLRPSIEHMLTVAKHPVMDRAM